MSLLAAACAPSGPPVVQTVVVTAPAGTPQVKVEVAQAPGFGETLAAVQARGTLVCGVNGQLPAFSFLDPNDRDTRAQLLDDSPIFELVHKDRIESLLDKAFLPNSQSKFLFYFLCAKLFLEELGR